MNRNVSLGMMRRGNDRLFLERREAIQPDSLVLNADWRPGSRSVSGWMDPRVYVVHVGVEAISYASPEAILDDGWHLLDPILDPRLRSR